MQKYVFERLPDVRARLRRDRRFPGTPAMTTMLDIWTSGQRFRIRDHDGRPVRDLLADVTEQSGLGRVPSTLEEFMDAAAGSRAPFSGPTDVYGDLSTGIALVREPHRAPWTTDAANLLPVIAQLVVSSIPSSWRPVGHGRQLNRPCSLYVSNLAGSAGLCTWAVAGPFILSRRVQEAGNPSVSVTVEAVELVEAPFEQPKTCSPMKLLVDTDLPDHDSAVQPVQVGMRDRLR
ncbi:hypothetical protein Kisp01_70780 [Kineosporia sp. NBRC 101677]|nr:hypothetical protein Kisp01_70780 [Kineosporia sp. NBRC 101677]